MMSSHRFAVIAVVVSAALLTGATTARANSGENPLGLALGFGIAGALGLGELPLLLTRDVDAPLFVDAALGVGGELDSFSMGFVLDGTFTRGSPWGLTSRVRSDFLVDPDDEASRLFPLGTFRWDVAGTGVFLGRSDGPLALAGVFGVTFWPSTVDEDRSGDTDLEGALGGIAGLRFQVRTPYVRARVELDYVPLLLESPTSHLHNLDLDARLGISPWRDDVPVTFEVGLKREIGLGDGPGYAGTILTLGAQFDLDEVTGKTSEAEPIPPEPW